MSREKKQLAKHKNKKTTTTTTYTKNTKLVRARKTKLLCALGVPRSNIPGARFFFLYPPKTTAEGFRAARERAKIKNYL